MNQIASFYTVSDDTNNNTNNNKKTIVITKITKTIII